VPKPCEHGCNPSTIYSTKGSYTTHLTNKHSGRWPSACSYPGCESNPFSSQSAMLEHLVRVHNVTDAIEQRKYLPLLPPKRQWIQQPCIIDGCKVAFRRRNVMTAHLRNVHKMSLEEASALIDERAQFETIARESRILSRKRKTTDEKGE
jgi:hypothetical protein